MDEEHEQGQVVVSESRTLSTSSLREAAIALHILLCHRLWIYHVHHECAKGDSLGAYLR